jgi:hypothetical protein
MLAFIPLVALLAFSGSAGVFGFQKAIIPARESLQARMEMLGFIPLLA